jgi:hypothetical protein
MDEEFVGGTSLQGACSNFRGKLCVWAHLLKISADNSKGAVEKLVPQGSGQAAVNKILSSIDKDVDSQKTQSEGGSNSNPSANAWNVKAPEVVKVKSSQQPRSASTGPARSESAGRSTSAGKSRDGSAGRGKQGAWREAKGPPEKGIGFKGARKSATSGLKKWKSLMASNKGGKERQGAASIRVGTQGKAAELKAVLGVISSVPPPLVANAGQSGRDAAAGLKALLGVGGPPQRLMPPSNDGFPPPPPPPPAQPTAADKLLQLMSKQQPQQVPISMPQASSFNFTYVEEGKEPPPSQQPHMSHMDFPPPPPPPMQMQMGPYGHTSPMCMEMPHPSMLPMQMMGHPNQFPPLGKHASGPPPAAGLSAEEFPPLGGSPPNLVEEKNKAADAPKKDKAGNMMVPSVVSSKAKGK